MPGKSLSLGIVIGATLGSTFTNTFRSVEQQSKRIGDSLKKAKLGSSITGDLLKYKRKLDQLKKSEQLTGVTSDAMKAKIAKAQLAFGRAARKAGKYGIEIGNAARKHQQFEREVRRSEKAMARLERRKQNQSIRGDMKGQALGLIGAAYGIGQAFTGTLEKESVGVRLETVLNSENIGRDLKLAKEHAAAFMRKGLTDDVQMLNIQYALNSAGLEASASRIGSEVVAKVATVTDGAPEQVGEVIATVFNNLGDNLEGNTQDKLSRIGDLLTKTQFKFQIRNFNQLGESMKTASPILSQYNVDLAQGVTLVGALNSAGLQGSLAGTALTATMRNMSKASEELGFEMVRNEKGQFDMIATMEALSEAVGGFDGMDQDTIDDLQKIFGDEGIRGITLLGKQLGKLKKSQNDVSKSSKGLVDSSYQKFLDSTPGKLKKFWHNTKLLGDTFTESFLPVLNQIIPPLTSYVAKIGAAISANPELGQTIVGIVVALTGLKAASMITRFGLTLLSDGLMILNGGFSVLKKGVGGIWSLLKFGGKAFIFMAKGVASATLGIVRLGVAMLASPITWIVGAVAALAAGAYLVYKNWEPIGNYFSNMWLKIKGVFAGGVASVLESIKSVATSMPDWALPEGLEADNIGATIEKYRELSNVTDKLKPVDFALPKMGEVMDDMGVSGVMKNFDALKAGLDIKLPDVSFPSLSGIDTAKSTAAAALSGIIAASPAAATTPAKAPVVTVHAPISIQAGSGADEERLAELVDKRLEAAVRRGVTEAGDSHD